MKNQNLRAMDRVRSWLGVPVSPSSSSSAVKPHPSLARHEQLAQAMPLQERLQKEIKTINIKEEMAKQELADLNEAARTHLTHGEQLAWQTTQRQVQEIQGELGALRARRTQLRSQLALHQTAEQNVSHAMLLRDGASELESITAAVNTLNVEDTTDRIRDAAADVQDHAQLLTADDIFASAGGANVLDDDALEQQWQQLRAEQAEAALLLVKQQNDSARPVVPAAAQDQPQAVRPAAKEVMQ